MYLKQALRAAGFVFVMGVFASGLGYLFRILLARNLSVAEYGLFYAAFSFFTVLSLFIDMGFTQAVAKSVIDLGLKKKFGIIKGILVYTLLFQVIVSALFLAAVLIFRNQVSILVLKSQESFPLIYLGLWFLAMPVPYFLTNVFYGFKKLPLVSGQELLRQLVALSLTFFLFKSGFGVKSPFIAYAAVNIIMFIVFVPFIKSAFPQFFELKAVFNKAEFVKVLKYGAYVTLSALTVIIITQSDTLMLSIMKGTEAVGLYQVAVPLALLTTYFGSAIMTAAFPYLSELHAKKEQESLNQGVALIYKYTLLLSIPVAAVLLSFSSMIIHVLFGAQYAPASSAMQILVLMAIFSFLTNINNTALLASGQPAQVSKNMLLAAVINVALNLLLIPPFGIMGAAFASACSYFFAFAVSTVFLKIKIGISVPTGYFIKILGAGVSIVLLINFLRQVINAGVFAETAIILVSSGLAYLAILVIFKLANFKEIYDMAMLSIRK